MVVREETAHRVCFELVGQKYEAVAAKSRGTRHGNIVKNPGGSCVFLYDLYGF